MKLKEKDLIGIGFYHPTKSDSTPNTDCLSLYLNAMDFYISLFIDDYKDGIDLKDLLTLIDKESKEHMADQIWQLSMGDDI